MGTMLYRTIRFIVKYLYIKLVFYKVEKNGWDKIPKDVPLLFAVTHPLMYIDAVVLASVYKKPLYFITKSTVFNTPFKKWLFSKFNMIPVVRKQDAPKGKTFSNKDMFVHCINTLTKGGDILIFSEGTSIWERKLRSIKSGTARIALETEVANDFNLGVQIVPVALNYTQINSVFPSVCIEVGDPILVKDYKDEYLENSTKTAQKVTRKIEEEISQRYFTLPELEDEKPLTQAVMMYTEISAHKRKQPLNAYFKKLNLGLDYVNQLTDEKVDGLREKVTNYHHDLEQKKISDYSFWNNGKPYKNTLSLLSRLLLCFTLFPFHLINYTLNRIPFLICKKLALKSSNEMEVWGANLIALCGIIFPLFYTLYITFAHFFLKNLGGSEILVILLLLPLLTYASYFFNNYIKTTLSDSRVFMLKKFNKSSFLKLKQERDSIIQEIDLVIKENGEKA